MLVLKTKSITEYNFFMNNKIKNTQAKFKGKTFAILTKNLVMYFDPEVVTVPNRFFINKDLKDEYALNITYSEYIMKDNSEQNVIFEVQCMNNSDKTYYCVTQMKQPYGSWTRIANTSGLKQGIQELIKDFAKELR